MDTDPEWCPIFCSVTILYRDTCHVGTLIEILRYTLKTGFTVLCDVDQRDVPLLGEIQHNTCIIMYVMLLNIELHRNISKKFPNIYLVLMRISLVKRTCTLSHRDLPTDTCTQQHLCTLLGQHIVPIEFINNISSYY